MIFIVFRVDLIQHSGTIYMATRRVDFTTEQRLVFVARY